MPRGRRISLEQRARFVKAFEDEHGDYLAVPDTIGVNRSTAKGIAARYLREGRIAERPRGGKNNVRVDEEIKECLSDIVNENCILTLSKINQELHQCLPNKPEIRNCMVSRTLQGMRYQLKLPRAAERS